ncbi:MAG: ABC transporter ATP-binding protein [Candidatus Rokubacteria bacterium]|nr:ABC transporter ATP-binding protein [Candidatus Rokubacteria bacterium]
MAAILEVDGLQAWYGRTQALHGVSFAMDAGGITTILGANGAGKTTTLRAISRMVKTAGSIRFDGARIEHKGTEDIVALGVAHVPQGRGTFVDLTVDENLRVGMYGRRDKSGVAEDMDRVYRYFPVLAQRRRQLAGTLSGGEQQMLAISRALMLGPRLLLLDEPSLGLAPIVVREIFRILKAVNQESAVTILLVEQNARLGLELADHAFLLETGRVVMSGAASQLAADDAVRRAYLGY